MDSDEGRVTDDTTLPVATFGGSNQTKVSCLYQVNGFWVVSSVVEAIKQMSTQLKLLPTDIILASFPKTGTTWLKSLLYSIIHPSSRNSVHVENPHSLIPTLEYQLYGPNSDAHECFPSINSCPRIFSTHLPYQVLVNTVDVAGCRMVYVTRNPKDTLVSMWQFLPKLKFAEVSWPLENAVNEFCGGFVPFGPFHDHVMGYRNESLKNPNEVFFVTYEELKNDCKTHVKSLAKFLGCGFDGADKEEELDEIVSDCSFEKLSKYKINKSDEKYLGWLQFPSNSFFRKGEVGDHKNFLSAEMINRIDKTTEEKFQSAGFMYGI